MEELKLQHYDSSRRHVEYKRCQGKSFMKPTLSSAFHYSLPITLYIEHGSLNCNHKCWCSFSFHQLAIQISPFDCKSWGAHLQIKDPGRESSLTISKYNKLYVLKNLYMCVEHLLQSLGAQKNIWAVERIFFVDFLGYWICAAPQKMLSHKWEFQFKSLSHLYEEENLMYQSKPEASWLVRKRPTKWFPGALPVLTSQRVTKALRLLLLLAFWGKLKKSVS